MRDSGLMLYMVYTALQRKGEDVARLNARLGVDPAGLDFSALRPPHEQQAHFWQLVEQVTADPEIGLHLCPYIPPFRGEVLEYLIHSSSTFGDGLLRASKYLRLLSDAIRIELVVHGDDATFHIFDDSPSAAPSMRHTEICLTYCLMSFCRDTSAQRFKPLGVALRCPPRLAPGEYAKVFDCPVLFGEPVTRLHFSASVLQCRSPNHDPELLRLHEDYASKRLARLERDDLIERIRQIFGQELELGRCDLDAVAARLGLAPRRLRFELAQAGTSFSDLLNQFRFQLARRLLTETTEPIDNIVYLTGFSEPSTFYRAFRRWSGLTPVQYRATKSGKKAAR